MSARQLFRDDSICVQRSTRRCLRWLAKGLSQTGGLSHTGGTEKPTTADELGDAFLGEYLAERFPDLVQAEAALARQEEEFQQTREKAQEAAIRQLKGS